MATRWLVTAWRQDGKYQYSGRRNERLFKTAVGADKYMRRLRAEGIDLVVREIMVG